jgi:hypothetical protein
VACCPPGELCYDLATGACPPNSVADPANPGCCAKTTSIVIPTSWNGPTSVVAQGTLCQPVSFDFFNWTCCGTPKVVTATASFQLQLIGSDGNPMTGVSVQAAVPAGAPFALDKSVYTTDAQGKIYPVVTWVGPGTNCNAPSASGNLSKGTATATFSPVNTPTSSPPIAQVQVSVSYTVSYMSNSGLCGSCP